MKMGKHSWLMMVGCAIPIVGIILLPLLGVKIGGVLPLLLILACPLSMMFMMGSGKGHAHSGHGGNSTEEESRCHEEATPREAPAPRVLSLPPKEK